MKAFLRLAALLAGAAGLLVGCSGEMVGLDDENFGQAEVVLAHAPTNASCLRFTVAGSRTDVRKFPLTSGERSVFRLNGLPVGEASFAADAFPVSCAESFSGVAPTWFAAPVVARLNAREVSRVALR